MRFLMLSPTCLLPRGLIFVTYDTISAKICQDRNNPAPRRPARLACISLDGEGMHGHARDRPSFRVHPQPSAFAGCALSARPSPCRATAGSPATSSGPHAFEEFRRSQDSRRSFPTDEAPEGEKVEAIRRSARPAWTHDTRISMRCPIPNTAAASRSQPGGHFSTRGLDGGPHWTRHGARPAEEAPNAAKYSMLWPRASQTL